MRSMPPIHSYKVGIRVVVMQALLTRFASPRPFSTLRGGRPCCAVGSFRDIDRQAAEQLHELVQIERLDQVRIEPGLARAAPVRVLAPTSQRDQRYFPSPGLCADPPCDLI